MGSPIKTSYKHFKEDIPVTDWLIADAELEWALTDQGLAHLVYPDTYQDLIEPRPVQPYNSQMFTLELENMVELKDIKDDYQRSLTDLKVEKGTIMFAASHNPEELRSMIEALDKEHESFEKMKLSFEQDVYVTPPETKQSDEVSELTIPVPVLPIVQLTEKFATWFKAVLTFCEVPEVDGDRTRAKVLHWFQVYLLNPTNYRLRLSELEVQILDHKIKLEAAVKVVTANLQEEFKRNWSSYKKDKVIYDEKLKKAVELINAHFGDSQARTIFRPFIATGELDKGMNVIRDKYLQGGIECLSAIDTYWMTARWNHKEEALVDFVQRIDIMKRAYNKVSEKPANGLTLMIWLKNALNNSRTLPKHREFMLIIEGHILDKNYRFEECIDRISAKYSLMMQERATETHLKEIASHAGHTDKDRLARHQAKSTNTITKSNSNPVHSKQNYQGKQQYKGKRNYQKPTTSVQDISRADMLLYCIKCQKTGHSAEQHKGDVKCIICNGPHWVMDHNDSMGKSLIHQVTQSRKLFTQPEVQAKLTKINECFYKDSGEMFKTVECEQSIDWGYDEEDCDYDNADAESEVISQQDQQISTINSCENLKCSKCVPYSGEFEVLNGVRDKILNIQKYLDYKEKLEFSNIECTQDENMKFKRGRYTSPTRFFNRDDIAFMSGMSSDSEGDNGNQICKTAGCVIVQPLHFHELGYEDSIEVTAEDLLSLKIANVHVDDSNMTYLSEILGITQVDSACTMHMTPHVDNFLARDVFPVKMSITIADGGIMMATGKVYIEHIGWTLLVPTLENTLISTGQLAEAGYKTVIDKNGAIIEKDGLILFSCIVKKRLLYVDWSHHSAKIAVRVSDQQVARAVNKAEIGKSNLIRLHKTLGHISETKIRTLHEWGSFHGLENYFKYLAYATLPPCNTCIRAKSISKQGYRDLKMSDELEKYVYDPFQVIAIDPIGPMHPTSVDGYKYALIAGDYKSTKYLFIKLLKSKAEVLNAVKEIISEIQIAFDAEVKEIQSDSDTLFVNDQKFLDFCSKMNIKSRYSPPYVHKQNGYIERNIGIVTDMTRTLMMDTKAPHNLWSFAMRHAIYILNRTPRQGTYLDMTPYQLSFGFKPSLFKMRFIFYQKVFYFAPKGERASRGKWQERGVPCRMLGVDENTKDSYIVRTKDGQILTRCQITNGEDTITEHEPDVYHEDEGTEELRFGKDINTNHDTNESVNETDDLQINEDNEDESEDINEELIDEVYGAMEDNPDNKYIPTNEDLEFQPERNTAPPKTKFELRSGRTYDDFKHSAKMVNINWATTEIDIDEYVPNSFADILSMPDGKVKMEWIEAVKKEINGLLEKNVFSDPVENYYGKTSGTRVIYAIRTNQDGSIKKKARLIVQGFNDVIGVDYDDKANSPASWFVVRLLLTIIVFYQIMAKGADVTQAYTDGDRAKRKFVTLPKDLNQGNLIVVELLKPLYGEANAGLQWERKVDEIAIKAGYSKSIYSPSMYYKFEDNFFGYMVVYVDDIIICTNHLKWFDNTMDIFKENVTEIRETNELTNYLGINIEKHTDESGKFWLSLNQHSYINDINGNVDDILYKVKNEYTPMALNYDEQLAIPINGEKEYNIQAIVGSLRFAAERTRPDIQAALGIISQKVEGVSAYQVHQVQRILRYIQSNQQEMIIRSGSLEKITCYVDAAFLVNNQSHSRGGYVMYYGENSSPVAFRSWKIKEVCTSSMHAELIPVVKAIQAIIYQHNMIEELKLPIVLPTMIYSDSQSLIDTVNSDRILKGSRHFLFRINYIRQMQHAGIVKLEKITGTKNVADMFTKPEDKYQHGVNTAFLFEGN